MPLNKPVPYWEYLTLSAAEKEALKRTYLGRCEVVGCTRRAVAYYHSAMWRLCAYHAALLARRTKEGKL